LDEETEADVTKEPTAWWHREGTRLRALGSHLHSNEDQLYGSVFTVLSIFGGAKRHMFQFTTEALSPFLHVSIICSGKLVHMTSMKLYPPKRYHCWKSGSECFS